MRITDRIDGFAMGTALRPKTLERYMYSLLALARFGIMRVEGITRETVKAFLDTRREGGLSAQTCNRDLAAILSFAGWLEPRGEFRIEEILALRRLRLATPTPPPPRFLTRAEYERLRAVAERFRFELWLAIGVAVHSGLRFNELRTLRHEDLALEEGHPFVHVRRDLGRDTKTGVERTPPISRAFAHELRMLGFPRRGPLFRHGRGKTLSPYLAVDTLQRWLLRVRQEAELGDATFTVMRHTYASWLVQAGVSIAKVARWMGHGIGVCFRHYAGLVPGGDPDVERGFAA